VLDILIVNFVFYESNFLITSTLGEVWMTWKLTLIESTLPNFSSSARNSSSDVVLEIFPINKVVEQTETKLMKYVKIPFSDKANTEKI
jgi:hypothetical protein